MMILMMRKAVVLVVLIIGHTVVNGDFLNEYFNGAVFGADPGPCPDEARKCVMNFDELPDEVLDREVCVFSDNTGCGPIRDILKRGVFEVWELQCRNVGLRDAQIRLKTQNSGLLQQDFVIQDFKLSCTFMLNMLDVLMEVPNEYRIEATIRNARVSFPKRQSTGEGTLQFEMNLFSQSFGSELPSRITMPRENCKMDSDLGLVMTAEDVDVLILCAQVPRNIFTIFLPKGFQCVDVADRQNNNPLINFFLGFFSIDTILGMLMSIVEGFIGGLICSGLEALAVTKDRNGVETDAILNLELKRFKAQFDALALTTPLDPADFDKDSFLLQNGVTQQQLDRSINLAQNDQFDFISFGLNAWLGGPSPDPRFTLVIDELINTLNGGRFTVLASSLSDRIETERTLFLNITNLELEFKQLVFDNVRFIDFKVLENENDQFRYTFQNRFQLPALVVEMEARTELEPGQWVTSGNPRSEFTFTFTVRLENLILDSFLLMLFDFAQVENVLMDQILATGDDFFLPCMGPGLYKVLVSDLESALDRIEDPSLEDFSGDGLSLFVEQFFQIIAKSISGALNTKLPGIMRGEVRNHVNEFIQEQLQSGSCPPPRTNLIDGTIVDVDLKNGILGSIANFFDGAFGGNPIVNTGADVNELVDTVMEYFVLNFPADFPLRRLNGQPQGSWVLKTSDVRLPSFQNRNAFIRVNELEILNFNSIHKLRITQQENAMPILFGVGGAMKNEGVRPLTISVPIHVVIPGSPSTDELFRLQLELSNMDTSFVLTNLRMRRGFTESLTLKQFVGDVACTFASYDNWDLVQRSNIIGGVAARVVRVASNSNLIGVPLRNLIRTLNDRGNLLSPNGRMETLVRSAASNVLNLLFDSVETIPKNFNGLSPQTCSQVEPSIDFGFDLTFNRTKEFERCLDVLTPVESIEDSESRVRLDPARDQVVDLFDNILVDGLHSMLQLTDFRQFFNIFGAIIERFPIFQKTIVPGSDAFDLLIPLDALGFQDDQVIKGLNVNVGQVRIVQFSDHLNQLNLFEAIGSLTTRYSLDIRSSSTPITIRVESLVELDMHEVNPSVPLGRELLREHVNTTFDIEEMSINFELVSAIDPDKLGEKSLSHFFQIGEDHEVHLAENGAATQCFFDVFYPGGLFFRTMRVRVDQIAQVQVTTSRELFSTDVEDFIGAIGTILASFYQSALENISENCLRTMVNDFIAEQMKISSNCPKKVSPVRPGTKFRNPDDHLFRFDVSKDWASLQNGVEVLRNESFQGLNGFLRDTVDGTRFEGPNRFYVAGFPIIYLGQQFGSLDCGLSDLTLAGFGTISELLFFQPIPGTDGYTTKFQVVASGPMSVGFDMIFNAHDVFLNQPSLMNDFRLEATVENLIMEFDLKLKFNLTEALELPFEAVSSLEKLICMLVPVQELKVSNFQLAVSDLDVEFTCIQECEFPLLARFSDFTIASTDSKALANELNQLLLAIMEYLSDIGAQALLNTQLSLSSETCDDALAELRDVVGADVLQTPTTVTISQVIGWSSGFFAAFMGIGYLFARPIHRRNKQAVLMANMERMKGAGGNSETIRKIALATSVDIASPFQHPRVPTNIKFLVPIICVVNLAMTIITCFSINLISIAVQMNFLGATTKLLELVPLTVLSITGTIWVKLSPFLAIVFFLACMATNCLGTMLTLMMWFAPATLVKDGPRGNILLWVLALTKTSLCIMFLVAVMMGAVQTSFSVTDITNIVANASVEIELLGIDVAIFTNRGLALLMFATFTTMSATAIAYTYFVRARHKIVRERATPIGNPDTRALTAARSIRGHQFVDFGLIKSNWALFIILGALAAILMILVGVNVPLVQFELFGIVGIALRELDKHVKTYSLVQLGALFADVPTETISQVIAVLWVQIIYYWSILVAPILQLSILVFTMVSRRNLRSIKRTLKVHRVIMYWAAGGVAVATVAVSSLLIAPMVQIYVNFVSSFIAEDLCDNGTKFLVVAVPNEQDAVCIDIKTTILAGWIPMVVSVLLQFAVTYPFIVLSDQVVKDRKYVAFRNARADMEIPYPTRWFPRLVLGTMTTMQLETTMDKSTLAMPEF